jgi:hypothetical protein
VFAGANGGTSDGCDDTSLERQILVDKLRMRALFIPAIFILIAIGCATTGNYEARVRSWEGKSPDELIQSWGEPNSVEKLSSGDRMLVYARLTHEPFSSDGSNRQVSSASPQEMYIKCATYFKVSPENKIISTLFQGDECKY